jgi:hypothetical protein
MYHKKKSVCPGADQLKRSKRVLRRIFGPKMYEFTREWRKLNDRVLNDLYASPSNVQVIKSRRMR